MSKTYIAWFDNAEWFCFPKKGLSDLALHNIKSRATVFIEVVATSMGEALKSAQSQIARSV